MMVVNKRRNRSDQYQWHLMEISVSPFILGDLSLAQGMSYRLEPFDKNEQLLDLKEKLRKRFWSIVESQLTDRQKQVIKLSCDGFTQNEIAKQLGINQTSVHKVISGNLDYKNKNGKRRYGGALKKIKKICQMDEEIQDILKEIQETEEGNNL